jgi:hypothetical protein
VYNPPTSTYSHRVGEALIKLTNNSSEATERELLGVRCMMFVAAEELIDIRPIQCLVGNAREFATDINKESTLLLDTCSGYTHCSECSLVAKDLVLYVDDEARKISTNMCK